MNFDDQKITAYALGELHGEDLKNFESELAKNPELQKEVEQIRQFSGILQEEFQNDPKIFLTPQEKNKIITQSTPPKSSFFPIFLTASAAALIAAVVIINMNNELKQAKNEKKSKA